MECLSLVSQGDSLSAMRGATQAVKYALKEIEGLKRSDGSEYKLSVEGDKLSDETIDDLSNIKEGTSLFLACLNLMNGIPDKIVDPNTGKEIEGIEIVESEKPSGKK